MTVKSGEIDFERLHRGIRRRDINVLKLALAVIVLRRRHAMKGRKKKKKATLPSLHCLPLEKRPDHLKNLFSMAEYQHAQGNNNRARAFLTHAAYQLVQSSGESRSEWIYTFLKEKALSELSVSLWGYILRTQPTLSNDVFAVALHHCLLDVEEAKPQWFLLAELSIPHTNVQILAQAWEQLTATTNEPIGLRSLLTHTPNEGSVADGRSVLTERLHSLLLWEEEKQQNAWDCCEI